MTKKIEDNIVSLLDAGFESIENLKEELKEDDIRLRDLLNKKEIDSFELEKFMRCS